MIFYTIVKTYMRTSLFCLIIAFLVACQDNSEPATNDNTTSDTTASQHPTTSPTDECFRKILSRDTFSLKLTQTANTITGTLIFDNYEKDSSRGTIKGKTSGDTLKLWYDFQSEGTNSVMEIYFKREGDKLIRGIGSIQVKGDTSYFSNPSDIKFEEKESWDKIACEQ